MDSLKLRDIWVFEKQAQKNGYKSIVGVDEAGRGPLAGPVVAAAVMLPKGFKAGIINDSKQMTKNARNQEYGRIKAEAAIGIGIIGPDIIDEINILKATHLAMKTALEDLGAVFDFILVDGLAVPGLPTESKAIIKGDSKSISIAAASIIAKVTRDQIMVDLHKELPHYGFENHKGYGTKFHLDAICKFGICKHHRKSFAPISERLNQWSLPGLE